MKLGTLDDLYLMHLRDVHSAEKQLVKALPRMAKAATNPQLKAAFDEHLDITASQRDRVESILEALGRGLGRHKCEAMEGLVAEGQELMETDADPDVLDAGLIVAAQKIEHYEIASYGGLRTFARLLGRERDAKVLQAILDEEQEADQRLTDLAERMVNERALS